MASKTSVVSVSVKSTSSKGGKKTQATYLIKSRDLHLHSMDIDPLPLKESFINRIEASRKEYERTGKGYTLEEMAKRYNIKLRNK